MSSKNTTASYNQRNNTWTLRCSSKNQITGTLSADDVIYNPKTKMIMQRDSNKKIIGGFKCTNVVITGSKGSRVKSKSGKIAGSVNKKNSKK